MVVVLYSLNPFGGVVGTIAAGFFLVKWFGVDWTLRLSAAINLIIAGIAILLDQQWGTVRAMNCATTNGATNDAADGAINCATTNPLINRLALWAFSVSGF